MISRILEKMRPVPELQRAQPTTGEFSNRRGRSDTCTIKSSAQWLKTSKPIMAAVGCKKPV
jgi:hypothetical protein